MCADRASVTGPRARDLITRSREEALADRPAYTTLLRLLTLGGRVPYPDAVDSLTVKERSVLQQTIGDEELRLLPADPHGPDGSDSRDLLVAYSPQGKLSLLEASEGRPAGVGDVLALLRVSRSVLERAEEEHAAWQVAEDREQARLDRILRGWEAAGSLPARVREAADWADHVETVLIYCGRQVFSRSDAGTSTLLRERPLRELAAEPPAAWSPAERLLVMAVHVLFATGRSIRFEEFNGRQLSATALRTWLVSTWHRYAHALGRHIPADLPTRPFLPLAAEVAELARAVDRSDWIRFRRITGTTFGKREVLAMLPRRERSHCPAPDALAALAERSLGHRYARELPGEELVARMVREAVTGTAAEQVPLLERILATIVESAVRDLDADYAMSSAVRDLRRLGRSGPVRAASPSPCASRTSSAASCPTPAGWADCATRRSAGSCGWLPSGCSTTAGISSPATSTAPRCPPSGTTSSRPPCPTWPNQPTCGTAATSRRASGTPCGRPGRSSGGARWWRAATNTAAGTTCGRSG